MHIDRVHTTFLTSRDYFATWPTRCEDSSCRCDSCDSCAYSVFWLNYIRLWRYNQSDRMRKEINQRRRHQARMRYYATDVFSSQDDVCTGNIVSVTRTSLFVWSSSIIMTPTGPWCCYSAQLHWWKGQWCRSRSGHWWSDVWTGRYGEAWDKKNRYTCHGIRSFSFILVA